MTITDASTGRYSSIRPGIFCFKSFENLTSVFVSNDVVFDECFCFNTLDLWTPGIERVLMSSVLPVFGMHDDRLVELGARRAGCFLLEE